MRAITASAGNSILFIICIPRRSPVQARLPCCQAGWFPGYVGEPAVGGRAVPMLNIRGYTDDIAFFQSANVLAAFLISSFSGKNQQNLSAAVLMPIGSGSGFKRNVAYRGVEEPHR